MTIDENRAREEAKAILRDHPAIGGEWAMRTLIERLFATEAAQPEGWVPSRVLQALAWYERHAKGCRKIGSAGDPFRNALDTDGGELARQAINALAASPTPPAPLRDAGSVERLREAYNAVAYWPEQRGDPMTVGGQGFMDLLALRNLVGEMLPALTARQDAATDAGVERLRKGLKRAAIDLLHTPRHNRNGAADKHIEESRNRIRDVLYPDALTAPKPDASQGEALATQENNHAG